MIGKMKHNNKLINNCIIILFLIHLAFFILIKMQNSGVNVLNSLNLQILQMFSFNCGKDIFCHIIEGIIFFWIPACMYLPFYDCSIEEKS